MKDIIEQDKNNKLNVNTNSGLTPYSLSESDRQKEKPIRNSNIDVRHVYDGDTFYADIQGVDDNIYENQPIRISGVDTPEINSLPQEEAEMAIKAKDFTEKALKENVVSLENCGRDKYFRNLCDVKVNGELLSDMLIKEGLAYEYDGGTKKSDIWRQSYGLQQERQKEKEMPWYKELNTVDVINDTKSSENEYLFGVSPNVFVKSNIKDTDKIFYTKASEGEGWNPDNYIMYQRHNDTTYNYAKNSSLTTAAKGFAQAATSALGGISNVAARALSYQPALIANLIAKAQNIVSSKKMQKQAEQDSELTMKAYEDFFKKSGIDLKLTDKDGKPLNYCPVEAYNIFFADFENSIAKGENSERVRNEAINLFNKLPDWQRIPYEIVSTAEEIKNALYTANDEAMKKIEEDYIATVNTIKWLPEELGYNFDEKDSNNKFAAEVGQGAFSVALTLGGAMLPGMGFAMPALFTTMVYDESIRVALENGVSFREAAAKSLIPAAISGALEKLKIFSLINRSKNLRKAIFTTSAKFWADEAIQETVQDFSVMASQEALDLTNYTIEDYLTSAFQDIIFTSITSIPLSVILNKRLLNIAKKYTNFGVPEEKAISIASKILEYGQESLRNKELQEELREAAVEAATARRYQKIHSDPVMKEDTRFDNPSITRERKDVKDNISELKKQEEAEMLSSKEEKDSEGKKTIEEGTWEDLLGNSEKMKNLFSGKMTAEQINKELYEVKDTIRELISGTFSANEEVVEMLTNLWYEASKINYIMTNEFVTPREFINNIFPVVSESFSLNIVKNFDGLRQALELSDNDLHLKDDSLLFKDVKNALRQGQKGKSDILLRMGIMSEYMSNILINKNKGITNEEALNFSVALLIARAKNKNLEAVLSELGMANLIPMSSRFKKSIYSSALSKVKNNNGIYASSSEQIDKTEYGSKGKIDIIGSNENFWISTAGNGIFGITKFHNKNSMKIRKDIINLLGLNNEKRVSIELSPKGGQSTFSHEFAHAVTMYTLSNIVYKNKKGIALNKYEKTLLKIANDFVEKNKKHLRKLYNSYASLNKSIGKDYNYTFEEFVREYINEFFASAIEYSVNTGKVPNGIDNKDMSVILNEVKIKNNTLHYGDMSTSLTEVTVGRGGRALSRAVEKESNNNNENIKLAENKRQNVANANQSEAVYPSGELNVELLNGENVESISNIKEKFDEDVKQSSEDGLMKSEEDLASDFVRFAFKTNPFVAIIESKQNIQNILSDTKTSIKDKINKLKPIINGLPNNNIGIYIKARFNEISESKNISLDTMLDFKIDVDLRLQDMALLEGFGLKRSLFSESKYATEEEPQKIKYWGKVYQFFETVIPEKIEETADSMNADSKYTLKIKDILKSFSEKYKQGIAGIKSTFAALDKGIDELYESSSTFRLLADGWNKAFVPLYDWANKINKDFAKDLRRAAFIERLMAYKLKAPLIKIVQQLSTLDISKEQRESLTIALLNHKWDEAKDMLNSFGVKDTDKFLSDIRENLDLSHKIVNESDPFDDGGIGFLSNYFPRVFKNTDYNKKGINIANILRIIEKSVEKKESSKNDVVEEGNNTTEKVYDEEYYKKQYEEYLNNNSSNIAEKYSREFFFDRINTLLSEIISVMQKLNQSSYSKKEDVLIGAPFIISEFYGYADELKEIKDLSDKINQLKESGENENVIKELESQFNSLNKILEDREKRIWAEMYNTSIENLYNEELNLRIFLSALYNGITFEEASKIVEHDSNSKEMLGLSTIKKVDYETFKKSLEEWFKDTRESNQQSSSQSEQDSTSQDESDTTEAIKTILETIFGRQEKQYSKYGFMNKRERKRVSKFNVGEYLDAFDGLSLYFDNVAKIYALNSILGKGSFKKLNGFHISSFGKKNDEAKKILYQTYIGGDNPTGNTMELEKNGKTYRVKLWGKIMAELGYATGNKHKDELISKMLDSFFFRGKPNNIFSIYRNANNILTINNMFSALSNFGDTILTTYRYGVKNTFIGLLKAAKGRDSATVDIEPIIENLYEEFRTDSLFWNKALDWVFKYSGFKTLDLFTKRASIEAALSTLKSKDYNSEKYNETLNRLKNCFGEEVDENGTLLWEKTLNEIENGIESDNVKFFLFNELSGQQPITLADVPYAYNKYPSTRLLYQFKTFAIKQLSFTLNEVIGRKMIENPEKGLKDLFYFLTALLMFNVPEAIIISAIKGEENISIPDEAAASIARFFFINKKAYYDFKRAEFASGIASIVIPTPPILTRMIDDTYAAFGDQKYEAKTLSSIPIVGEPSRVLYKWWFS